MRDLLGCDDASHRDLINWAIHRYYTCSTCARKGKLACKGRSIRMDKLDGLVTEYLVERLLKPESLAVMLSALKAGVP